MVVVSLLREVVGQRIITRNNTTNMTKENDKKGNDRYKLQQIIELLKFALSLEDHEIIRSTVEQIVELLEEEVGKYQ